MGVLLPIPPLALAVTGLEPLSAGLAAAGSATSGSAVAGAPRVDLRGAITVARQAGYRGLVLDATDPQTRPRELDRSARREIASLLRRNDLACAGVDVFVPAEHLKNPATVDRAVNAVLGAIELAADLASAFRVVNVALPTTDALGVGAALREHAEHVGVRIADFAFETLANVKPRGEAVPSATAKNQLVSPASADPVDASGVRGTDDASPREGVGVGIDTAAAILAGHDPIMLCASLAGPSGMAGGAGKTGHATSRLVCVRVTDVSRSLGGMRVALGSPDGRLDVSALAATLGSVGYDGPVVVDVRGVRDQAKALAAAPAAWSADVR